MSNREQFTALKDSLIVLAPAKINLSLLIAGKREDGFHAIETLMAKIDICDEILIQKNDKLGIEVISTGPYWAPQGKENLIHTACETILKHAGVETGIKITLTKNIPAGSGLGSASSDAAAALLGINKFLNLKISHQKLHDIAAILGSDVAFFLYGPLSFCSGKGEKIEKISNFFDFTALLVLPNVSVSTKRVYENYTHDQALYHRLNLKINELLSENRFDLIAKMCANMLSDSCFRLQGDLADLRTKLESLGIRPVCLSGSGSAMYILVDSEEKAKLYQFRIKEILGCNTVIVSNNRW